MHSALTQRIPTPAFPPVLASQSLPASALTGLSSLLITSSNDPRRHAVAFHLYRVAFGADPAGLPEINLSTSDLQAELPGQASSSTSADDSKWGDWQAAYHWASLVMQGRAPPPPGTTLLPATEQRQAQAKQSSTAYKVFAHLAQQGHPRGIFGIAQQLLSSLDRGVDPTVLGTVAHVPGQEQNTRQERVAEIERLYRQAGEAGVEEAWFQLGALYTEGKWVRKDEGKARGFLQEAVQQGSPRACQALAHLLTREAQAPAPPSSLSGAELNSSTDATLRQDRLEQSLELLERGAQLGSAECAFSAGMRYLLQDTAGNDEASRQADSSASLDLSLDSSDSKRFSAEERAEKARSDHRTKWGVQPDDSIASQWLTQAAEGGNTLAMMNLARMYLEGRAGGEVESSEGATSPRMQQLLHSSSWYSKILAKAMGPEGQRAKALAEVQAKLAQQAKGKGIQQPSETPEPGMSLGSGRLDDLGARAEEGLRVVREELARLTEQK